MAGYAGIDLLAFTRVAFLLQIFFGSDVTARGARGETMPEILPTMQLCWYGHYKILFRRGDISTQENVKIMLNSLDM